MHIVGHKKVFLAKARHEFNGTLFSNFIRVTVHEEEGRVSYNKSKTRTEKRQTNQQTERETTPGTLASQAQKKKKKRTTQGTPASSKRQEEQLNYTGYPRESRKETQQNREHETTKRHTVGR